MKGLGLPLSLGFTEGTLEETASRTRLLKLHGSVDWAIPQKARTKVVPWKGYRDIVDAGLTPQIIPPTWKKDSRGVFDVIWDQSLEALSDATRVVILGFSIPPTDLHFKYLLAAGLRENYSLREIVFVNPAPGMQLVQERSKVLFANQEHNAAKVRFVNDSVERFVGQGTGEDRVHSIGRGLPASLQDVQFEGRA